MVESEFPKSFAICLCVNVGLIELISMNRDLKSNLFWRSIKLVSRFPLLDICSKKSTPIFVVRTRLGIWIKEK